MTVLPIHLTGSGVLHAPTSRVETITEQVRALVDDMVDTMHAAPGVGLAAPQVGHSLAVFVWHYESDDGLSSGVVINPRLRLGGPWDHRFTGRPDEEGCLSIPGLRYPLARAHRAHLTGLDLDGGIVDVQAEGWLARIFQHEYDHLQGILYRDRLRRHWRRLADADIAASSFANTDNTWLPGPITEEDFVD